MRTRAAHLKVWAALLALMSAAAMVVSLLVVNTEPAGAAFPGTAGAIAFTTGRDGGFGSFQV